MTPTYVCTAFACINDVIGTSTGRTCDGYPHIATTGSSSSSSSSPDRTIVTVQAGPSVELFDNPQSKRSFAFFRQRTSPQLSGFFKSEFWESLVFRVAHHESAIRYALVALGAAHEASEGRPTSPSAIKSFAVEQYNLAIKELLVPLAKRGQRAVDVCLIACIMFVNFEVRSSFFLFARSYALTWTRVCGDVTQQP